MNQILNTPKSIKKYKLLKTELTITLILIVVFLLYIFYLIYLEDKRKEISRDIFKHYKIAKLYSNVEYVYNAEPVSPYIIGNIEIPSISISLPIISETTDELLKLSVCRFYGPLPNQIRKYLYCWA